MKMMKSNRRLQQEVQSKLLNTSLVVFVIWYVTKVDPQYINPWNLTAGQWVMGGLCIRGAISFYDHLVVGTIEWMASMQQRKRRNQTRQRKEDGDSNIDDNSIIDDDESILLPTRRSNQQPARYVSLDTKSILFLVINSVDEWIFVQRLLHYIWFASEVSLEYSELSLKNTVGALWVMFVVLDLCYAPLHHILHQSWCYALVHKHHHRQHYPTRGYLDAGNEHPLEHFIGIGCTWAAVGASTYITGAHAFTIFLFFNIHAALAMLNHSPYNIQWTIPGLGQYSVGNHEMHHRKFTINYAQYCMWYDYMMNTYASYEGPSPTTTKKANTRTTTATAQKDQNRASRVDDKVCKKEA
mmetsp:Transcript_23644/g.33183  ORF Transcript_23644/g.33183 Transcript_23644/m.33183 type:complete len:354 (-) Transcript_23644:98-1159(-)